ncbi:MAG TPA: hypothetical protein VFT74_04320 [Isosphaeraceae bacterium]|nr:hypothetical protein [Isosphaeraceae bacterium]
MTRDEQFALIETARDSLMRWAGAQRIPLHRMEYVVPFVDTNFGLSAWFFYKTDEQLRQAEENGWSDRLSACLVEVLRDLGYAPDWLWRIRFFFDSHENVLRHYEGS